MRRPPILRQSVLGLGSLVLASAWNHVRYAALRGGATPRDVDRVSSAIQLAAAIERMYRDARPLAVDAVKRRNALLNKASRVTAQERRKVLGAASRIEAMHTRKASLYRELAMEFNVSEHRIRYIVGGPRRGAGNKKYRRRSRKQ